jgi:hypothetical protein
MAHRIGFALFPASLFIASTVALTNAQQYDWGAYYGQRSALLRDGMTEEEVVQIFGYQPNKVDLTTCGQVTSGGGMVLQDIYLRQSISESARNF